MPGSVASRRGRHQAGAKMTLSRFEDKRATPNRRGAGLYSTGGKDTQYPFVLLSWDARGQADGWGGGGGVKRVCVIFIFLLM